MRYRYFNPRWRFSLACLHFLHLIVQYKMMGYGGQGCNYLYGAPLDPFNNRRLSFITFLLILTPFLFLFIYLSNPSNFNPNTPPFPYPPIFSISFHLPTQP